MLGIYYNYTNKRSDEVSAMGNSAYLSLYQDGVQMNHGILSYDSRNAAVDNHYKNVMTGTTIEVAEVFELKNHNDVTLTIKDIFDFTGKSPKLKINFSL